MSKSGSLMKRVVVLTMALFLSASAFFYAPIEVSASETDNGIVYGDIQSVTIPIDAFFEYRQAQYYKSTDNRNFYISGTVRFSQLVNNLFELEDGKYYRFVQESVIWASAPYLISPWDYGVYNPALTENGPTYYDLPSDQNIFLYQGQNLRYSVSWHQKIGFIPTQDADGYYYCGVGTIKSGYTGSVVLKCQEVIVTGENEDLFNQGYDVGYAEGESVGYGNGYSQGFIDGEASVDTDAIYDEAFQAGKDSVDTQSYYDAGYQAGYQVAYSEGYESGYDVGYQSAMDRIENWGADTTVYPKILYSDRFGHTFQTNITYATPFSYRDSVKGYLGNIDFDPNHTYKFNVGINPYNWDNDDTIFYEDEFYFNIGGIEYPLFYSFVNPSTYITSIYVPGDRLSDSYYLVWNPIRATHSDGGNSIISVVCPYSVAVYDMGPAGDTQNHIANQTDQLTNGYDSSQGNAVNDSFNTSINDYNIAEDSLFNAVNTGLDDFEFFDFESVPAMVTGITFVTSIMDSLFNAMGGASGAGIVLSVLFTIVIVSMALGLARFYQSDGRRGRKE